MFVKHFLRETKQQRVAVVESRGDKTVNKSGSSVECEGETQKVWLTG